MLLVKKKKGLKFLLLMITFFLIFNCKGQESKSIEVEAMLKSVEIGVQSIYLFKVDTLIDNNNKLSSINIKQLKNLRNFFDKKSNCEVKLGFYIKDSSTKELTISVFKELKDNFKKVKLKNVTKLDLNCMGGETNRFVNNEIFMYEMNEPPIANNVIILSIKKTSKSTVVMKKVLHCYF